MSIASIAAVVAFNANRKIHGVDITYARGNLSFTVDDAIPGSDSVMIDKMTEVTVEGIDGSFIVLASELLMPVSMDPDETLPPTLIEPERGDLITDADSATWEVTPFDRFGCFRNTGGIMRIFAKKVAA